MEKTNKQKLNLGIFVIITTLIVITAIYYIGNKQNIFGNTFRMSSVFNNVMACNWVTMCVIRVSM